MKYISQSQQLLLTIALGFGTLLASSTSLHAIPDSLPTTTAILAQPVNFNPPSPPPDPAPGGRVRGGAKRGLCQLITSQLTALAPFTQEKNSVTNVWGLTTVTHPTFWFYLPSVKNATLPAEFVLQDSDSNPIYEQAISLQDQPGVVGVTLPATVPPLALNKRYRWFFSIYCDPEKQSPPIYVEGVIQRVELNPTIKQQLQIAQQLQQFVIYAHNGIWYDALTTLAQLRQKNLQDQQLQTKWQNLLSSIRLDDVGKQPILSAKQ
ncbi:MAG: DUF928 domain-containing protein [Gloeotrichia echinulata GP01]